MYCQVTHLTFGAFQNFLCVSDTVSHQQFFRPHHLETVSLSMDEYGSRPEVTRTRTMEHVVRWMVYASCVSIPFKAFVTGLLVIYALSDSSIHA